MSKPFRGHHPSRDCALPRGTAAVAAWRRITHFEERACHGCLTFPAVPFRATAPAPGAGSPSRPARLDGLSTGWCLLQRTRPENETAFRNDLRMCPA